MDLDLKGKLALITGAERGLGEKISLRLAGDGADVIIHYVFDEAAAERVAAKAREKGVNAYVIRADFTVPEDMKTFFEKVRSIGSPDILINNAGFLSRRLRFYSEDNSSDDIYYKSFEINYMAVVRTMREFIPGMVSKGWGRIVNISSVTCRMRTSTGATVHYSPMKSAVETLTRHISDEVAQYGVTCNCVGPGNMRTDMVADAPLPNPKILELYHTRRNADPDEIAATVEFLAAPDAGVTTGEVFYTSGGR